MANNLILDKLEGVKSRFIEVGKLLMDSSVMSDMDKYIKLNKEYKDLEPIINAFNEYKLLISNIEDAKNILSTEKDDEMRELAKGELDDLLQKVDPMEEQIKILLIPKDTEDDKSAILEIRAGTGGDEASLFAGELMRMYKYFCDKKGWKTEITSYTEGTVGGYKEVVLNVTGHGVYGILKYESGVHRVQRVPQTETQGRVHTSAASVAVLPEADEVDVKINPADVKRDEYCSSGPGGQSVNTTYSAIRLTHIPTGIVVTCQDEKSKMKNLDSAMKELRTRLYNLEYQKYLDEIAKKRKTMVSTGDRSAKIRTYNYPQGRVTDHRVNYTMYNLPNFLQGELDEVINQLIMAENAERLKEAND